MQWESSQLDCGNLRKDTAKIAIDARPGGPVVKT
jgi:hypothetical protein